MDKRHFKVIEKSGKEHGLYISSIPSSAAKKRLAKFALLTRSKR